MTTSPGRSSGNRAAFMERRRELAEEWGRMIFGSFPEPIKVLGYRADESSSRCRAGFGYPGCARNFCNCRYDHHMEPVTSNSKPVTPRGSLPQDARVYRSIGPFDALSAPKGLLGKHDLKPGAWARLCVTSGSVRFVWDDPQGGSDILTAGTEIIVPPCIPHHLELCGPLEFAIHFCKA